MRYKKFLTTCLLLITATMLFANVNVISEDTENKIEIYNVYGELLEDGTEEGILNINDIAITKDNVGSIVLKNGTIELDKTTVVALLNETEEEIWVYLISGKIFINVNELDKKLKIYTPIATLEVKDNSILTVASTDKDFIRICKGKGILTNGLTGRVSLLKAPVLYDLDTDKIYKDKPITIKENKCICQKPVEEECTECEKIKEEADKAKEEVIEEPIEKIKEPKFISREIEPIFEEKIEEPKFKESEITPEVDTSEMVTDSSIVGPKFNKTVINAIITDLAPKFNKTEITMNIKRIAKPKALKPVIKLSQYSNIQESKPAVSKTNVELSENNVNNK